MSWTQETPSQEGTYWFRRFRRTSPEQVTIKGDKVVFNSGNIKDLGLVKGQWLGPIVPSKEKQEDKPGFLKRVYNQLPGFLFGIASTIAFAILIPVVQSNLSITEPKLVYDGELPEYPKAPQIVQTKVENGRFILHIKHKVPFKNYGVPKDHIDRVEIERDGLNPAPLEVKVLHVDQAELGWRERKEIEFDALIYLDPIHEKAKKLSFKTYFYASKGNEIYGGGMVVLRGSAIFEHSQQERATSHSSATP